MTKISIVELRKVERLIVNTYIFRDDMAQEGILCATAVVRRNLWGRLTELSSALGAEFIEAELNAIKKHRQF